MKDLTFQQIEDAINKVLSKNQLKPALSIGIDAQIRKTDAVKDYFSVAIYQGERSKAGATLFHYFHCGSVSELNHKLQFSIEEKNK
ncbi:MAG: hypothetical protein H7Y10_12165 [Flavobacterium sp.]|nr:hypothetical protein [Flavobacterium sp.]